MPAFEKACSDLKLGDRSPFTLQRFGENDAQVSVKAIVTRRTGGMSGLISLLNVLLAEYDAGRGSVLATVVEGSAYRRPGARMLVSRFGRSEGAISDGCLESAAARKDWWLTESVTEVRSYSTAMEDEEDGEEALSATVRSICCSSGYRSVRLAY